MNNPDCVVLFSGGLDSCCALGDALYDGHNDIVCFMIDYGQIAYEKEKYHGNLFIDKLKEKYPNANIELMETKLDLFNNSFDMLNLPKPFLLSGLNQTTNNAIPQRNMIFTMMALSFCELANVEKLYVGYGYEKEGNITAWDSIYHFVDFINHFRDWKINLKEQNVDPVIDTQYCKVEPTIYSPMYKQNRNLYIEERISRDYPLDLSWSCYGNGEHHCRECSSCKNRFSTGVNE